MKKLNKKIVIPKDKFSIFKDSLMAFPIIRRNANNSIAEVKFEILK